jgi:DNA-binding MarR family transcriptional regulator
MLRRAIVTRMLQRIERDGLIVRFRDPDDKRTIRVRLTAAGNEAESVVLAVQAGIETAMGLELRELHAMAVS